MTAWAGGKKMNSGSVACQSMPQNQNTTPMATPSTAATTMSTVRQAYGERCAEVFTGGPFASVRTREGSGQERPRGVSPGGTHDFLRWHDPDQVSKGLRGCRTLSAEALPCRFPPIMRVFTAQRSTI